MKGYQYRVFYTIPYTNTRQEKTITALSEEDCKSAIPFDAVDVVCVVVCDLNSSQYNGPMGVFEGMEDENY